MERALAETQTSPRGTGLQSTKSENDTRDLWLSDFPATLIGNDDLFDEGVDLNHSPFLPEVVPNARVTGEGVVFVRGLPSKYGSDRKPQPSERILGVRWSHFRDGLFRASPSLLRSTTLEQAIWGTDNFSNNYYHWFCKDLLRLEAARQQSLPGPILIPENIHRVSFVRDSLEALSDIYLFEVVPFRRSRRVKQLRAIEPARYLVDLPGDLLRQSTAQIIERLTSGKPSKPSRRIYITRAKAGKRQLANEVEAGEILKRHGYEAVAMELHTLAEQIEIMQSATHVASVHGAGLTNMIFMPPGGSVLEIRRRRHPACFRVTAVQMGHKYWAIPSEPEDATRSANFGNVVVDLGHIETALTQMN